ncbi:hypothetical protein COCSADRAFT_180600 [Bipolaris sorokiniana ND90Pr]|uniref:Uncharacterized protein n=1 Tax=Cochliobolus sativus (strain ND90Pr / ATCC 201652) TaxID=665912 RepID=M2RGV6_COCSN|nr:uncharacterized protein COCSADRAFT_180600 [Bipolaris sorokiniana ND90Pr]EMD65969.1 hypothetical protein COCSADRAFT_180600 [Bipolaris sorokiniana ND90Pr]
MPTKRGKQSHTSTYGRSLEPDERSKALQAATHRRGGTHKVRDSDRTNSVYDAYNYKELLDAAKERGVYRKDMKKVEMAWALKRNDEDKKRAERENLNALRKKQEEAKRKQERIVAEQEALIEAKLRRKVEKMRKKERHESVSDDTISDNEIEAQENIPNEYMGEAIGYALSDSSWDSTSTESIPDPTDHILIPSCKLQLLEWPHEIMPPVNPPCYLSHVPALRPTTKPYAPLKIITTTSKQKICLPGLKYPPTVDPDFVPLLPDSVRAAAHEGRLEGILCNAIIETGEDWASRTLVRGNDATLYFHIGNASTPAAKSLADVYSKWSMEDRGVRRVEMTCEAYREAREKRKRRRKRIKGKLLAEVYETCKWRPRAVGYVPAYLDFGLREMYGDEKELRNLRYVRFNSCDVPHYYFWVRDTKGDDEKQVNDGEEPRCYIARKTVGKEHNHGVHFAKKQPYKPCTHANDNPSREIESTEGCKTESFADDAGADMNEEALCRRASTILILDPQVNHRQSIMDWLEQISPSFNEPPLPLNPPEPFEITPRDANGIDNQKATLAHIPKREITDNCPFCSLSWTAMISQEQADHMLSHGARPERPPRMLFEKIFAPDYVDRLFVKRKAGLDGFEFLEECRRMKRRRVVLPKARMARC